jgi:hypothetical protein
MKLRRFSAVAGLSGVLASATSFAAETGSPTAPAPAQVLFNNVRIFNGTSDKLAAGMNVLVEGNSITRISAQPIRKGTEFMRRFTPRRESDNRCAWQSMSHPTICRWPTFCARRMDWWRRD